MVTLIRLDLQVIAWYYQKEAEYWEVCPLQKGNICAEYTVGRECMNGVHWFRWMYLTKIRQLEDIDNYRI